jgi:SAM-dependent methyltransferase
VLDVGCGTGSDAVFLARHGVQVTGIDVSPAMIAQAESKIAHHGLTDRVRLVILDIGELASLPAEEYDGVISSYAALNTLPTLTQFAADAARLMQPDGRMILHLLNGSSLWEWGGLIAHRKWAEARSLGTRRERIFEVGGHPVPHYLTPAGEAYASSFSPHFRLCRGYGLGITRPLYPIARVPETVFSALGRLDELVGPYYPFLNWGRFYVLELMKAQSRPRILPRPL